MAAALVLAALVLAALVLAALVLAALVPGAAPPGAGALVPAIENETHSHPPGEGGPKNGPGRRLRGHWPCFTRSASRETLSGPLAIRAPFV